MAPKTSRPAPARERLLAAADELFYAEGVRTVGIDRVIEHAAVAKATLYNAFGSKDELIRAYLERRHAAWRERMDERLAGYDTPIERLLGVFDALGDFFGQPGFHGCAFMNAGAEERPGGPVQEPADAYRAAVRSLFAELAAEAGAAAPEVLARQLALLYDGATITARMDRDATAAEAARAAAATLVAAALTAAPAPAPA